MTCEYKTVFLRTKYSRSLAGQSLNEVDELINFMNGNGWDFVSMSHSVDTDPEDKEWDGLLMRYVAKRELHVTAVFKRI